MCQYFALWKTDIQIFVNSQGFIIQKWQRIIQVIKMVDVIVGWDKVKTWEKVDKIWGWECKFKVAKTKGS